MMTGFFKKGRFLMDWIFGVGNVTSEECEEIQGIGLARCAT